MAKAPYPHQPVAKQRLSKGYDTQQAGHILAHAMSGGKSRTTAEWIAERGFKKSLIISPAGIRPEWREQFQLWAAQVEGVVIAESGAEVATAGALIQDLGGILVTSYELMDKVPGAWDVVVFDEAHYLAKMKSKRTNEAFSLVGRSEDTFVVCLSGTPIPQTASDLFPLMNLVAPSEFPDYWAFMRRYANKVPQPFAPSGFVLQGLNPKYAPELYQRIQPWFHRVTREEFAHLLPKFGVSCRYIKPKRTKIDWDDEASYDALLEMNSSSVLDEMVDLVEEARRGGQTKFVIGCWLNDTAEQAAARLSALGIHTFLAHGRTEGKKRATIRQDAASFVGPRALVVTIETTKEGLNNLGWAETVILTEVPWRANTLTQWLGRFGRGNQEHNSSGYIIVAQGTRGERAAQNYIRNQEEINQIVRPGVDETRAIVALKENEETDESILASLV